MQRAMGVIGVEVLQDPNKVIVIDRHPDMATMERYLAQGGHDPSRRRSSADGTDRPRHLTEVGQPRALSLRLPIWPCQIPSMSAVCRSGHCTNEGPMAAVGSQAADPALPPQAFETAYYANGISILHSVSVSSALGGMSIGAAISHAEPAHGKCRCLHPHECNDGK